MSLPVKSERANRGPSTSIALLFAYVLVVGCEERQSPAEDQRDFSIEDGYRLAEFQLDVSRRMIELERGDAFSVSAAIDFLLEGTEGSAVLRTLPCASVRREAVPPPSNAS